VTANLTDYIAIQQVSLDKFVFTHDHSVSNVMDSRGVHGNGEDWDPMGFPWDSHGNGSKISHGMGMGWEWELSAREWELRRGSCHQQLSSVLT